jgi:hypothetical protein
LFAFFTPLAVLAGFYSLFIIPLKNILGGTVIVHHDDVKNTVVLTIELNYT